MCRHFYIKEYRACGHSSDHEELNDRGFHACKKAETRKCEAFRISLGAKAGFCARCIVNPESTRTWIVAGSAGHIRPREAWVNWLGNAAIKHSSAALAILQVSSDGRPWAEKTLQTPERRELVNEVLESLLEQFWYKLKHPLTTEAPTTWERHFILQLRTALEISEIMLLEQRLQKFEEGLIEIDLAALADDRCAICYQDYGDYDENGVIDRAVEIPCNFGHTFHEQCILKWLYSNQYSCPTDRDMLTPEQTEIDLQELSPSESEHHVCPFIAGNLARIDQHIGVLPHHRMLVFRLGANSSLDTRGIVEDQSDNNLPSFPPAAQNLEVPPITIPRYERIGNVVREELLDNAHYSLDATGRQAIDTFTAHLEQFEGDMIALSHQFGIHWMNLQRNARARQLVLDRNPGMNREYLAPETQSVDVGDGIEEDLREVVQESREHLASQRQNHETPVEQNIVGNISETTRQILERYTIPISRTHDPESREAARESREEFLDHNSRQN